VKQALLILLITAALFAIVGASSSWPGERALACDNFGVYPSQCIDGDPYGGGGGGYRGCQPACPM
jgi:hypothetical protein